MCLAQTRMAIKIQARWRTFRARRKWTMTKSKVKQYTHSTTSSPHQIRPSDTSDEVCTQHGTVVVCQKYIAGGVRPRRVRWSHLILTSHDGTPFPIFARGGWHVFVVRKSCNVSPCAIFNSRGRYPEHVKWESKRSVATSRQTSAACWRGGNTLFL